MRKWITLLMTLLVGSSASYANANAIGQVNLEAGYRRDNISWRHRFPSDSPFVSSSTRFKDIDIFQLALNARAAIGCNLYVRGNAYWGWVLDGNFEQGGTTYFDAFSQADLGLALNNNHNNVVDDKYVYGASAAIGYPFYFCDCTTSLAPVIGYSIDEQNLSVQDGGFDLYESNDFLFPVSGNGCCQHKFISKWYGPFVGLDFTFRPYCGCWNFYAQLEYHWGNFKGKRHNTGFTFFDCRNPRSNNVRGWVFAAGADYALSDCWTLGISVKFQNWNANRHRRHDGGGSYESYFFDGSYGRERTNDKWRSYAVNVTIGRDF